MRIGVTSKLEWINRRGSVRAWLIGILSAILLSFAAQARNDKPLDTVAYRDLPVEAHKTLSLIRAGGPYPFAKDGTIFSNRERRLPMKPRGYYREYTVITPGLNHRGARRIVAGGSTEFYFTADHYETFRLIVGAP